MSIEPSDDPQTISNAICNAFATGQIADEQDSDNDDTLENGECRSKTGNCRVHNPKPKAREGETSKQDWMHATPNTPPAKAKKNIERAVEWSMKSGKDAQKVIHRDGLGYVDLPIGRSGSAKIDYKDGYGLSHIIAKHGKTAAIHMGKMLSSGKLEQHPKDKNKRIIKDGNFIMVVTKRKKPSDAKGKGDQAWIVTSFDERKNGKP